MSSTGYRLLGFAVWHGGRWYLRRTYGHLIPSRRVVAGAVLTLVALGALGAAVASDE